MKKQSLFLILTFFVLFPIVSQNLEKSILTISDSLKTNANAVIRLENTNIEIFSPSKMVIQKEKTVTVLNKLGNDDGYITLYYDKDQKLKNYSARVYDAHGFEIKKINASDFQDVSAADGFSLYNDNRIKYYHYVPISYPYTIVYSYEITTSNTAFIPRWIPINYFSASTEKSNYTLSYPSNISINFKERNFGNLQIENNSIPGKFSYTLKNAQAIRYEPNSPYFIHFGPQVQFAANKFHLAGVDGQADNWNEFGKWMYDELLANRSELTELTVQEIKTLVKDSDDPIEKARLIYKYMQEKTRYISIQIGIGGWKPMTALEVDKLGYGDCKALTNYTHSLLKVAGINSMYTVLYADERRDIDSDLASIQGNHAILMVPMQKDTVWLECTSQKVPFGYLGDFTDDRDVLVVSPDGGKILHTKAYKDAESKQLLTGEYTLDKNGNITAKVNLKSSGVQYDDNYPIAFMNPKDRETHYKDFFKYINTIKIGKIAIKSDDIQTIFIEDIDFTATNYGVNSGERMLVRLNAFNVNGNIPNRIVNRKLPLEIQYGFLDIDEVIINLPTDYSIEALAKNEIIENNFGTYKMSVEQLNDHQLKYSRELLIKQGMYQIDDYEAYRQFHKKINQNDNAKIVLIKKPNP